MKIVNFAHPLTPAQLEDLQARFGLSIEEVISVPTQFDPALPFGEQAIALVDRVGLSSDEWQTEPPLVNLPSLSIIAALVLAGIEGRSGHLPAVVRLRPVADAATPRFEVAEVLNLYLHRNEARQKRSA